MHLEGKGIWHALLASFERRTGHSLDCKCHEMNETELSSLRSCERLILESASCGNLDSAFFLALHYMRGVGIESNYKLAEKWLTPCVEKGYARAEYMLGCIYLNGGPSLQTNKTKGIHFLRLSAAHGDHEAQLVLGDYLRVAETYEEREEGFALLLASAAQGNTYATYDLGCMYYEGLHKTKSNELSFAYCESAAKRENAKAMYMLSGLYKRGHGVAHSEEKSQEWLKKSEKEVDSLTRLHIDAWFRKYENS